MNLLDESLYCTNHAAFPSDKGPWPKELIQNLCTSRGLEYKDGYENRVLERVVAEPGVDRAGRRIVLEGGRYEEYAAKPMVLWMHDEQVLLGYSLRERVDEGVLKSLVLFLPTENPKLETHYQQAKSGVTKASSICIRPIKFEKSGEEVVFKSWDLVAVSICSLWVTTEDFGEIYYNDLIKKHEMGREQGLTFVVFSNEGTHEKPHFHVMKGKEKLAAIHVDTGVKIIGELSAKERTIVKAWFDQNQGLPREMWNKTRPS